MTTDYKDVTRWVADQKIKHEIMSNGMVRINKQEINSMQMTNLKHMTFAPGIKVEHEDDELLVLAPTQLEDTTRQTLQRIVPLEDRVIVEEEITPSITKGGIIIPDTAKEKPNIGVIRVVGDGKNGIAMKVREGNRVIYGKWAGEPIEIDNHQYLIMRESDILAII